jgi:DNA-binding NarL/FixJ family response regulator
VAQRLLRTAKPMGDDVEALDACLVALLNHDQTVYEAATRTLRVAGLGGIARFLDAVGAMFIAPRESAPAVLTNVELQVLQGISRGLSNQAIADEQRRTINTVRTHVSAILRKLECESRGEAVAAARRRHLI